MANAVYTKAKTAFMTKLVDLNVDTIRVYLVSAGYTANMLNDQFLSSVPVVNRVSYGDLTGKSVIDGVFDASDLTIASVTGSAITQVVVVQYTGSDATSRLLWRYDNGTGLPVTPNGGDITITWDNGANKILAFV
jgi:hypothetical protein